MQAPAFLTISLATNEYERSALCARSECPSGSR